MNEKPLYNQDPHFSVQLNGKETDYAPFIISAETRTEYNKLSVAEIVLDDGGLSDDEFKIGDSDSFFVGKEIAVFSEKDSQKQCLFKGIVELQNIVLKGTSSKLKITAKHVAYKMTLERKLRSFENMTDSDLIQSICSEYGIDVVVDNTNVQHERLVQYNCTDWDFVNLRAEAMGLMLYTTPSGIVIKTPDVGASPVLTIANGYNLVNLDVEMDARHLSLQYSADAWNYATQEIEQVDSEGGEYDNPIGNQSAKDLASKNNVNKLMSHRLSIQENSDSLMEWNKALAMRSDLSRIVGTSTVWGFAPIEPGDIVRLENVGKRFDGNAIVSSVIHSIDNSDWTTTIHIGVENVLYADRYDNIASKPADGETPPVNGLQIAKVKALEGDPLGEERIYISLLNNENTKLWARVSTLDAGNDRGTVFCPEIDDEVVVGFINDNPNQAVVLGMLHSSSSPSPLEKSDDNHLKAIVTREKLRVDFDDENKIITISTPGGNKLALNDDDGGVFIEDQNGNKITMDSNGIVVETNKVFEVKASQDVKLEGNNTTVKANAQLKLQGTAGSELSASGNTVVKGAIVQIN